MRKVFRTAALGREASRQSEQKPMSQEGPKPIAKSPYVVGPLYDWGFFLLPPLVGLLLGVLISGTPFTERLLVINGQKTTAAKICIGILIHAHLVAVFFRSHNNTKIFALYPYRFLLVPVLLWGLLLSSTWLAVTATVVATFWDVWHSGAQTFGFARIYDRNAGNQSEAGRRLDYWLNQLLYAGPILAGATLMDHVEVFEDYEDVNAVFFTQIPAAVEGFRGWLVWGVLLLGTVFIAVYLFFQWRLSQKGHHISGHKVFLLAVTGLCSIYNWGFNSWGEAFFMMNFFHAVQYLALVWGMEKKNIIARLRLTGKPFAVRSAAVFFFSTVALYGFVAELFDEGARALWALTIVVSLMHFWYDGFVWSVRRQQV